MALSDAELLRELYGGIRYGATPVEQLTAPDGALAFELRFVRDGTERFFAIAVGESLMTVPSLTMASVVRGSRPWLSVLLAKMELAEAEKLAVLTSNPNLPSVIEASTTRVGVFALLHEKSSFELTVSIDRPDPATNRRRTSRAFAIDADVVAKAVEVSYSPLWTALGSSANGIELLMEHDQNALSSRERELLAEIVGNVRDPKRRARRM